VTDIEIARSLALAQCVFPPKAERDQAAAKKFAYWAVMNAMYELLPKQKAQMERLAWKYRDQIPKYLVPASNPAGRHGTKMHALRRDGGAGLESMSTVSARPSQRGTRGHQEGAQAKAAATGKAG
jgi:hypothetical protein